MRWRGERRVGGEAHQVYDEVPNRAVFDVQPVVIRQSMPDVQQAHHIDELENVSWLKQNRDSPLHS